MPDVAGVYCLEFENGRIYIGSSRQVRRRILRHLRDLERGTHSNRYLLNVYRKYGRPSFRLMLQCRECDLLLYEQIALDALRPDLNLSPTAGRNSGHKFSPEGRANVKAAVAESWKTRPRVVTSEHREKLSAANLGRSFSAETRAKISAAKKGHVVTAETRAKLRAAKLGRPRLVYAGKPWGKQ